jgi:hypothetical protein
MTRNFHLRPALQRRLLVRIVAAAVAAALLLGIAGAERASAAPTISIVSDMVDDGRGPKVILDADAGIPVRANGRIYWLYDYGCHQPYWNIYNQAVRRCFFSLRTQRGQHTGMLLGTLSVWFRWDGYGYNEVIRADGYRVHPSWYF